MVFSAQKATGLLALASLSFALPGPVEQRDAQVTPAPAAHPSTPACPSCYTYTETRPFTKTEHCPPLNTCPPHPLCLIISTSTVVAPCTKKECPITPTVVVTAPPSCPTCVTGCDTTTTTTTVTKCPK